MNEKIQVILRQLQSHFLQIHPIDELQARSIAKLRVPTQPWGLSLGDRACLALASSYPKFTCPHM
ncbi:MAG: hypothetical protein PUP93_02420 [Rhizonema sp. NSF051]|nr:hypothetical protein [Rhizonema sp. NSF051]